MKYWIPSNWDDTFEHEGLLFFIQRIQEMLFHFSSDVHRAPVHNTSTLIKEYLKVYNEVKAGEVKNYQLKYIFQELENSFSNDKILFDNLGNGFISVVCSKMKECKENTIEQYKVVNYIHGVIRLHYLEWTIAYLKNHIATGNHKAEIENGARCWISNIIMNGYSAEFIYRYVEDFFIKKQIKSLDDLDMFFDRFDFKMKSHKVYLQISDSIDSHFELLKTRLSLDFNDDGNFYLIQKKEKYSICYFEIEALDYYSAMISAYKKINIFFKYYRFITNIRRRLIDKYGMVLDIEKEQSYNLPIVPTGFKSIEVQRKDIDAETIDMIIIGLQRKGTVNYERINKAIELHNSAIRQQLPKDGFANLWSALEVLCPQGDYDSKLDSILNAALPIMQNDYFMTLFESIYNDMKDNLEKADFDDLVSAITLEENMKKMAAFCLLPEYEELREDYFEKLKNMPLLRHKIFTLYVLKSNKKALFELSKNYRKRVRWHFYRLYRVRNSIVHSGSAPQRIRVLGEHLHSYLDGIMYEIAVKLAMQEKLTNIDSVFADANFLITSKEKHFSNDGPVTSDDIEMLLDSYFCK